MESFMVLRTISTYLQQLAQQYPVVTLTGPRQSGKTTLARSVFKDKAYINLELHDNREFARSDPRGFLRRIPDGAILDEIQRVPELVSYLQGIVDDKRQNGMFILTGSQQFEVSNSINQSLAGRTALLKLLPFTIQEVCSNYGAMDVENLLYRGFYPRIYDQNLNPTQALGDYFETYVERDLRQLIHVKNLSSFQKFVKLCAGRIGQVVNLSSLGNDAGVTHTTVHEWLTILEASYVVFLLQPFYRNVNKRLIKSPKLYFYDVGLASFLLGIEKVNHLDSHPLKGHLFENLAVMEILKYRYNCGMKSNLNFYRDNTGNEIDVIYNVGQHVLPIEIKAGETVTQDFFKGLTAFQKVVQELPFGGLVIYAGNHDETRKEMKIARIFDIADILGKIQLKTAL